MTLEEAIVHAEEVANQCMAKSYKLDGDTDTDYLEQCAAEHRQLAEWLRELQAWRKAYDNCVNTNYESIDDSVRRLTIIGQVINVRNVFADIRRIDNKNG